MTIALIQMRRDSAANWTSANPTLASGEFGYETDTGKFKIGNGATAWNSLGYLPNAADLSGKVDVSALTESVQDVVGALLTDASPFDFTYNDAGNVEAIAFVPTAALSMNSQRLTTLGAHTADGDAARWQDVYQITANRQTGSYTLVLADAGKVVEQNVAGGNNLTVPPNSSVAFPVGTMIEIFQYGAGQTTIVAGAGVTLRSPSAKLKLTGQYSSATLRKIATDEWAVAGDLAA